MPSLCDWSVDRFHRAFASRELSTAWGEKQIATNRNKSRAGDYFVGGLGEDEIYVAIGIGFEGLWDVQGGEGDFLGPVSVGVVVAAGVEDAVGDGVVADFFAVSVAEDQESWGEVVRWRWSGDRGRWRESDFQSFAVGWSAAHPDVVAVLEFDHQRLGDRGFTVIVCTTRIICGK